MNNLEIYFKSLKLNETLCEANNYLKKNIYSGSDTNIILDSIEEASQSIFHNVSPLLDDKQKNEFKVFANKLQKLCGALKKSKSASSRFFEGFSEWENACLTFLYVQSINEAFRSSENEDSQAVALLDCVISFLSDPSVAQIKSIAEFVLSRKLSKTKPQISYDLAVEAFELNHTLSQNVLSKDSSSYNYSYKNTEEVYFDSCPVCHGSGTPFYCAMPLYAVNYSDTFSPVKLWMKCDSCGQLYAYNFPKMLTQPQPEEEELGDETYMQPKPFQLPLFGNILKQVIACSKGKRLLEVGAGTGELIAAALELGCEVEAIEISKRQARRLTELLGIDVHCMDFLNFSTSQKFNIVTMGDVIEHVTNPSAALEKAHELLEDDGILWISTPNFESGFSRIMKYNDPMWNEPYHITYFSYSGFEKLLREKGFEILGYSISQRYNGSMEITARKVTQL